MAKIVLEVTIDSLTNEEVDSQALLAKVESALKVARLSAEVTDTLDSEYDEDEGEDKDKD